MEPANISKPSGIKPIYLAVAFIIASALLLAFEGSVIKNTIGGERLFWYAAIAGVVFALLLWKLFSRRGLVSSSNIVSALVIGCFLFFPSVTSIINRSLFLTPVVICNNYPLIAKSSGGSRYIEYCLFVNVIGAEEKFTVSEEVYKSMVAPGLVELCTQKGVLGYEVVKQFKPVE